LASFDWVISAAVPISEDMLSMPPARRKSRRVVLRGFAAGSADAGWHAHPDGTSRAGSAAGFSLQVTIVLQYKKNPFCSARPAKRQIQA
jgi:hypothetical protein